MKDFSESISLLNEPICESKAKDGPAAGCEVPTVKEDSIIVINTESKARP